MALRKFLKPASGRQPATGPHATAGRRPADRSISSEPSRHIRVNKFFTEHGWCSRREADRLIEEGRVAINGRTAVLGDRVGPRDVITQDGIVVPWRKTPVYIKFHKPIGVTTTSEPHVQGNIIAYIGHPERIFPIGRLDKDSSGLMLLTNDGDIVNRVLRAEYHHEKEYLVQVDRSFDQTFLDRMAGGVVILNRPTRSCVIRRVSRQAFRIILTEGRNRQIRRMCHAVGYRVVTLHRTRIMNITIDDLPVGQWQNLTEREREKLLTALARSDEDQRGSR